VHGRPREKSQPAKGRGILISILILLNESGFQTLDYSGGYHQRSVEIGLNIA
jgi:hypothetical protein